MTQTSGPRCGAKRHGTDATCTLPAGWGTDHVGTGRCRKHFGNAPNVIKAAGRQRAGVQAREELARLKVRPVSDPVRELRRVGGQIVAWKDVCAGMLNRLDPDGLRYEGKLHGEQLRAEVQMWTDALKMSVQVLTALGKLDLDNWQAAIDQQRADVMAQAFEAAHAKAGLPADRAAIARADFVSRLRVLSEEDDDGAITGVVIPVPGRGRGERS